MKIREIKKKIKEMERLGIETKGVLKSIKKELKVKYGILDMKELNKMLGELEADIQDKTASSGKLKRKLEALEI